MIQGIPDLTAELANRQLTFEKVEREDGVFDTMWMIRRQDTIGYDQETGEPKVIVGEPTRQPVRYIDVQTEREQLELLLSNNTLLAEQFAALGGAVPES